ncbi:unnamed protein product [Dicrocoelium dendriticum]|nr:unnamed protein product [Dicrocoelium dendriticum]
MILLLLDKQTATAFNVSFTGSLLVAKEAVVNGATHFSGSVQYSSSMLTHSFAPLPSPLMMTIRGHLSSTKNLHPDSTLGSWSPIACTNGPLDSVTTPGDLVSLAWLQKGDIIQIAPLDGEEDFHSEVCAPTTSAQKSEAFSFQFPDRHQVSTGLTHHSQPPVTSHFSITPLSISFTPPAEHLPTPCSISYPPFPHVTHLSQSTSGLVKPNYSYTHLIFMAIESTPQKCMTVNQIYNWCESNFPFYKHAGAGWKNSLRHNLSINKSFKRLPRDSRGPGRGAFWTVEPRERSALLDAIKRNPWNFANMTAIVSAQSDGGTYASSSLPDSLDPYVFGARHLTQSAADQLLRSEDVDRSDLCGSVFDPSNGMTNSNTPHNLRLISTPDGQLVATFDNKPQSNLIPDSNHADIELRGLLSRSFTTCMLTDCSPEPRVPHAADPSTEWPAEEEEKYLHSLRLLTEADDASLRISDGDHVIGNRLSEPMPNDPSGPQVYDDTQTSNKRRRKSRLQPTRFGFCNECKENAASGCESCHTQQLFFTTTFDESQFVEHPVFDIANTLDSDQEHGPAGGPAARKHSVHSAASHFSGLVNGSDKDTHGYRSEPISQEVYVTPAPYIDHEYSHCQAQLRGPEDNRMVDRYNEEYCSKLLKRSRGQHRRSTYYRSRSSNPQRSYKCAKDDALDFEELDEVSNNDDPYASRDHTDGSDESNYSSSRKRYVDKFIRINGHNPGVINRKHGRYKRRGDPSYDFDYASYYDRFPTRVLFTHRHSQLKACKRRGTVYSRTDPLFSSKTRTRRSKRIVKAPRRPYDEFEASFSIDEADQNAFDLRFESRNTRTHTLSHAVQTTDGSAALRAEPLKPTGIHQKPRRGRYTGRKRLAAGSLHRRVQPSFNPDVCSGSSIGNDRGVRCFKAAYKLQGVNLPLYDDESSTSSLSSETSQRPQAETNLSGKMNGSLRTFGNSVKTDPVSGCHRYNIGSVWGQSRMSLARKMTLSHPSDCSPEAAYCLDGSVQEPVLAMESFDQDLDECEEDVVEEVEVGKTEIRQASLKLTDTIKLAITHMACGHVLVSGLPALVSSPTFTSSSIIANPTI